MIEVNRYSFVIARELGGMLRKGGCLFCRGVNVDGIPSLADFNSIDRLLLMALKLISTNAC